MSLLGKSFTSVAPGRLLLLLCLGLLVGSVPVIASSGGPFDLSWHTVDGGGGAISGGSYALGGTIGQADAGGRLSGGDYTLTGGFWAGVEVGPWTTYLPIIVR